MPFYRSILVLTYLFDFLTYAILRLLAQRALQAVQCLKLLGALSLGTRAGARWFGSDPGTKNSYWG